MISSKMPKIKGAEADKGQVWVRRCRRLKQTNRPNLQREARDTNATAAGEAGGGGGGGQGRLTQTAPGGTP